MLKPLASELTKHDSPSNKNNEQTVENWYGGITLFYSLFLDEAGSLAAAEEETSPELESLVAGTVPKMYVPKWIRQLDIPWYSAKEAVVLRESDNIPPFHPDQVRVGKDTYFLKMVDPTQPQPTRREIDYLKRIEKAGLHEKFRVPLLKGLIGFEDSKTEMMGFLMTEIDDPMPLTHLLDEKVPQDKRNNWAEESKRIVSLLHEKQMVWGDAKADNFMVDKHDNLWIIDFGGSYTDGWIDPELMETEAGDDMGVERVVNALYDPVVNTFDPNQQTLSAVDPEAGAGNKRKVGRLDEDSVHKDDQSGDQDDDESPPKKRARKEESTRTNMKQNKEDVGGEDDRERPDSFEDDGVAKDQEGEDIEDVNEGQERYCFCEKPSSGDMIACDNDSCARQWFHFDCIGLEQAPKSKHWYCDDCKDN